MKKLAILTSILALAACSGGHHGGSAAAPILPDDTPIAGDNNTTGDADSGNASESTGDETENENTPVEDNTTTPPTGDEVSNDTPATTPTPTPVINPSENLRAATNVELRADNNLAIVRFVNNKLGSDVFAGSGIDTSNLNTLSNEDVNKLYNIANAKIENLNTKYLEYTGMAAPTPVSYSDDRAATARVRGGSTSTVSDTESDETKAENIKQIFKLYDISFDEGEELADLETKLTNSKNEIKSKMDYVARVNTTKTFADGGMGSVFKEYLTWNMSLSQDGNTLLLTKKNRDCDGGTCVITSTETFEIDLTKHQFENGAVSFTEPMNIADGSGQGGDKFYGVTGTQTTNVRLGGKEVGLKYSDFALISEIKNFETGTLISDDGEENLAGATWDRYYTLSLGYDNKVINNIVFPEDSDEINFTGRAFGAYKLDSDTEDTRIAMDGDATLTRRKNGTESFTADLKNMADENDTYNVKMDTANVDNDIRGKYNPTGWYMTLNDRKLPLTGNIIQYYGDDPLSGTPTEAAGFLNYGQELDNDGYEQFDVSFGVKK